MEVNDTIIEETISEMIPPLVTARATLLAHRVNVVAELAAIDGRVRRIDSILRAADPEQYGPKKKAAAPKPKSDHTPGQTVINRATAVLPDLPETFTVKDLSARLGISANTGTVSSVLNVLRDSGAVRMVGKRGPARVFAVTSNGTEVAG